MKRLAVLACLAMVTLACGNETADAPAAAVESTTVESVAAESTSPAPNPVAPVGLVSRDDVVITAPTVLWFWAPG